MCKVKGKEKELFIIAISLNGFILGISSVILWSLVDSMEFLRLWDIILSRVKRHGSQLRFLYLTEPPIWLEYKSRHRHLLCNQKHCSKFQSLVVSIKESYHFKSLKELRNEGITWVPKSGIFFVFPTSQIFCHL